MMFQLHHVGYAVREIAPAAEAYVARFGYEIVTPVIHDAYQTADVQFLRLPADQAYLEFVAPDGPGSKLAGAIKRGSTLNHLCYIAGPLDDAVAHLEREGLRQISEYKPGVAFAGRRLCWLLGPDGVPIELVEQAFPGDMCAPGIV